MDIREHGKEWSESNRALRILTWCVGGQGTGVANYLVGADIDVAIQTQVPPYERKPHAREQIYNGLGMGTSLSFFSTPWHHIVPNDVRSASDIVVISKWPLRIIDRPLNVKAITRTPEQLQAAWLEVAVAWPEAPAVLGASELHIMGVHIPHGESGNKRAFWDAVIERVQQLRGSEPQTSYLVCGRTCTGRNDVDRYDGGERFIYEEYVSNLEQLGWTDTWRSQHGLEREYTFVPKNARNKANGFRIDQIWASPSLKKHIGLSTHCTTPIANCRAVTTTIQEAIAPQSWSLQEPQQSLTPAGVKDRDEPPAPGPIREQPGDDFTSPRLDSDAEAALVRALTISVKDVTLSERRKAEHQAVLDLFWKTVRQKRLDTIHIDALIPMLHGGTLDGRPAIIEVKTITLDNEVAQCRHAVSQLLEYRYIYRKMLVNPSLWVLFSERPSTWIERYLQHLDIEVLWVSSDRASLAGQSLQQLLEGIEVQ
jgi:hypothetical protein